MFVFGPKFLCVLLVITFAHEGLCKKRRNLSSASDSDSDSDSKEEGDELSHLTEEGKLIEQARQAVLKECKETPAVAKDIRKMNRFVKLTLKMWFDDIEELNSSEEANRKYDDVAGDDAILESQVILNEFTRIFFDDLVDACDGAAENRKKGEKREKKKPLKKKESSRSKKKSRRSRKSRKTSDSDSESDTESESEDNKRSRRGKKSSSSKKKDSSRGKGRSKKGSKSKDDDESDTEERKPTRRGRKAKEETKKDK